MIPADRTVRRSSRLTGRTQADYFGGRASVARHYCAVGNGCVGLAPAKQLVDRGSGSAVLRDSSRGAALSAESAVRPKRAPRDSSTDRDRCAALHGGARVHDRPDAVVARVRRVDADHGADRQQRRIGGGDAGATTTPDAVVSPLQYAVAVNCSWAPACGDAGRLDQPRFARRVARIADRGLVDEHEAHRGPMKSRRLPPERCEMSIIAVRIRVRGSLSRFAVRRSPKCS